MKLILSRKGFDSQYGGIPSPILPDGRLVSFPIPYEEPHHNYNNIYCDGVALAEYLESLSKGKISGEMSCHLDPDLSEFTTNRQVGWRPVYGQVDVSQSHLSNEGVGVGDVFLFFGWFRQTEFVSGKLRYCPKAPDLHVIFGWLEIGEVVRPSKEYLSCNQWLCQHPHCCGDGYSDNNTLYIAKQCSSFLDSCESRFGGGVFPHFNQSLQLTKDGQSRSVWKLPLCFDFDDTTKGLSYHRDRSLWTNCGDHLELRSRGKGQEFVLSTECSSSVSEWVKGLLLGNLTSRCI